MRRTTGIVRVVTQVARFRSRDREQPRPGGESRPGVVPEGPDRGPAVEPSHADAPTDPLPTITRASVRPGRSSSSVVPEMPLSASRQPACGDEPWPINGLPVPAHRAGASSSMSRQASPRDAPPSRSSDAAPDHVAAGEPRVAEKDTAGGIQIREQLLGHVVARTCLKHVRFNAGGAQSSKRGSAATSP